MATSNLIVESYQRSAGLDKMDEKSRKEMLQKFLAFNKENHSGSDFLTPLSHYHAILEDTNEVLIKYMSQEKKDVLLRDLQVTYLLLLAQNEFELTHQKTENTKLYQRSLQRCQQLLDKLNYEKQCQANETEPNPEFGYATEGKLFKFLGIFLGQWLALKIVDAMDRKTKSIKEAAGWFNEKRLYWVWGSSFLNTVLGAMPPDFLGTQQAQKVVKAPSPYTGIISWALYYFRFALNLSLLLKHTIAGPWMSKEEKSVPWTERFLTQWDQRKFTLLNDSIWATGNLVCFFWLTGKSILGTWGDALTLALLVFDLSLALWEFEEQKTRYNKEMLGYEQEIERVSQQIKLLQASALEDERKKVKELHMQLAALERAKNQCKKNWDYQVIGLATGIAYAVGLMIAFALLTMPFMPIAGIPALAVMITGAVLCFAFSVIYNAVKSGIELHKTRSSRKETLKDMALKIDAFKELLTKTPPADENEKKFLFLEIQKALAETAYQKDMAAFQTMHLFRSIIIECIVPVLIFISFVFLPLGAGFGVLGAALALAFATNTMINKLFKPKKEEVTELDQNEYKRFCANPDKWATKSLSSSDQKFFKPAPKVEQVEEGPSLDDGLCSNDEFVAK